MEKGKEENEIENEKIPVDQLTKLDKIRERLKKEEIEKQEKREKEKMLKRAWRKKKEKEENKLLIREAEKVERREKKKMLEERWTMLRWVTGFIEKNQEKWTERDERRGEKVTLEEWDMMERNKKEEIIKNIEKESLKEKGERLAKSWKVWREEGPPFAESEEEQTRKYPWNVLPELESEEIRETSARTILKSKTLIRS
jgi:hypothetical protein